MNILYTAGGPACIYIETGIDETRPLFHSIEHRISSYIKAGRRSGGETCTALEDAASQKFASNLAAGLSDTSHVSCSSLFSGETPIPILRDRTLGCARARLNQGILRLCYVAVHPVVMILSQ